MFLGAAAYQPHAFDQFGMYADLVYNAPGLTEADLSSFYKDAAFGVPDGDIERVYSPVAGVTVVRDKSYGVAHIFGQTRYATMYAQGYTAAEDRLFLMDVLRHLGRARLSEFLGNTPDNNSLDRDQLSAAPYTEADLTAQINALRASGAEGNAIADDGQAYTDGVNGYITEALADPAKLPAEYTFLGATLNPWVPEDMIAIASKVGAIFGRGGGGEVANYCGLQGMTAALGSAAAARAVFDDFHFQNDGEAVTTAPGTFPYMTDLGPVDPASQPAIDCSTLSPVIDDGPPSLARSLNAALAPHDMSNALLVSGAHTANGHPIAVFGPQTGYFMPQLLIEKDVHGPGIDARGAAFAGVDLYVQLGRGTDYAWSATSSNADNVDQWVLKLCDPLGGPATISSMGYLHNATCVPIETYQHTEATAPPISWRVERTPDYGPISERGTLLDGTPIAIASERSTYGNELGSAHGFYRVNDPAQMANGFADFQANMGGGIDYSFNWFYVDDAHIGYQHSCKCPQRATGVDPYLPSWGTGQWDWQGYIPIGEQPTVEDPPQGFITSWNNKQAPEFSADDRSFGEGPVQRVQILNTRIEAAIAAGPLDRAALVNAMEDGGTVDLRGQEVLPLLLQVMGATAPGGSDARAQDMRDRLAAWAAAAAHRRDFDDDGAYDDAQAPAIMDAWWPLLVHAEFDAGSGNAIANLGLSIHDAPQGHNGSAFGAGSTATCRRTCGRRWGSLWWTRCRRRTAAAACWRRARRCCGQRCRRRRHRCRRSSARRTWRTGSARSRTTPSSRRRSASRQRRHSSGSTGQRSSRWCRLAPAAPPTRTATPSRTRATIARSRGTRRRRTATGTSSAIIRCTASMTARVPCPMASVTPATPTRTTTAWRTATKRNWDRAARATHSARRRRRRPTRRRTTATATGRSMEPSAHSAPTRRMRRRSR